MLRKDATRQHLCVDIDDFSLHAAVGVEADDRKRVEQLCHYIARRALSDERVQLNAAGQAVLKLKTSWRDGTTHLVMSPLEVMQRMAALDVCTISWSREAHASDCFAAANRGIPEARLGSPCRPTRTAADRLHNSSI